MSTRHKTIIAILMFPLAMLLAFGSIGIASAHSSGKATTTVVAKKKPSITISMFTFTGPGKVKPGAKIKIVNKDSVAHTVTSDTDAWTSVDVPAKSKVTLIAPSTPGSYPFHCTIHPTMLGTLTVK